MTDEELDLDYQDSAPEWAEDAIDAASDQGRTTWLTTGGKRIAKIAPVDEIPPLTAPPGSIVITREQLLTALYRHGLVTPAAGSGARLWEALGGEPEPGGGPASAAEFLKLGEDERRAAVLGRFYERLRGQS